ncbi:hypothetical protein QCA50_013206 [Cerrena zonata]|uniref:SAM-dependent MTase RsmB/NOP-type domain-containing protein n=1 Tax=Cerrena zonata TaxID=2478898 RepID=A0AAW0G435_9APHY
MTRTKNKARRGKGRKAQGDNNGPNWRTDVVEKLDMNNERFEKYYKTQNILPDTEWDDFLKSVRQPLPTTFRVTGSRQAARLLNDTIKETHVPHLAGVTFEEEAVSPPSQIPWYPDGLAWQFNVSKKVLRKQPEFKKFHNFLVFETEVGNISRQEAVSMLPPLFLEVEPHHRVMDMCAAPGSKTAQLLEALHAQDTETTSSIPSGLLIANDSDNKRTHLLIHQSSRLPSPALMVTNHDASIFPAIKIPSEQVVFPSGTKTRVANKRQHQLLFDRILCDVPCSGDGTLRKNPGIWKSWSPMDGNGLHGLQIRILQRAMRMLKKGGRIVYSTCSMNPVENEAVIVAALKSIPGFELVDATNHLPGLKHRPGLTTWTPSVDRSVVTDFTTYHDFIQSLPEEKRADTKLVESQWPPSAEDAERLHITRCLRIYPHLQDTGGFFVAVLQKAPAPSSDQEGESSELRTDGKRQAEAMSTKTTPMIDESEATTPANESGPTAVLEAPPKPDTKGKAKAKQSGDIHFKENPYTFVSPEDPIVHACITKLNLKSNFPASNILVRNPAGDPVRSLYMTNDIVKSIVENNDYQRLRLMTCGTKVMGKQEGAAAKREGAELQFRVLDEGLPVLLPFIEPESIVTADLPTLKILMETYYPLINGFPEPFRSIIEAKTTGSHVVRFVPSQAGTFSLTHELILPLWKSNASLTLMIEKKAKSALSLRVFGEDITAAARQSGQEKQQPPSQPDVEDGVTVEEAVEDDNGTRMPEEE